MKKTDEKIIRFVEEYQLIKQGDKILVALSGGPDSIFLLHFLLKYKRKYGIEIGAMHVNHMIRGEQADNDEEFCRKLCLQLETDYHTEKKMYLHLQRLKKSRLKKRQEKFVIKS